MGYSPRAREGACVPGVISAALQKLDGHPDVTRALTNPEDKNKVRSLPHFCQAYLLSDWL
jgi:hypothetical protein